MNPFLGEKKTSLAADESVVPARLIGSDRSFAMSLFSAGRMAEFDGYVGYMEPYATSHQALDADDIFQQETLNAARALGRAVQLHREGKLERPDAGLTDPAQK